MRVKSQRRQDETYGRAPDPHELVRARAFGIRNAN